MYGSKKIIGCKRVIKAGSRDGAGYICGILYRLMFSQLYPTKGVGKVRERAVIPRLWNIYVTPIPGQRCEKGERKQLCLSFATSMQHLSPVIGARNARKRAAIPRLCSFYVTLCRWTNRRKWKDIISLKLLVPIVVY